MLAPPAPAQRLPDAANRLGALDTSGVVALAGGSAKARAATTRGLALLGFDGALGHAWKIPQGVYVVIVYRFTQPSGASGLVQGLRARPPGALFASRTVPQAVAYSGRSKKYYEQHASFARGSYVYEVNVLSTAPLRDAKRFDALLARQAATAARLDP